MVGRVCRLDEGDLLASNRNLHHDKSGITLLYEGTHMLRTIDRDTARQSADRWGKSIVLYVCVEREDDGFIMTLCSYASTIVDRIISNRA